MVFLLVVNVFCDTVKPGGSYRKHTIATLPTKRRARLDVNAVGGRSLEIMDEVGDGNGRCKAHQNMDMIHNPIDRHHGTMVLCCLTHNFLKRNPLGLALQ